MTFSLRNVLVNSFAIFHENHFWILQTIRRFRAEKIVERSKESDYSFVLPRKVEVE